MKESSGKINFRDLKFGKQRANDGRNEVRQTSDAKSAIKIALGRLNKKAMVRRAIGAGRPKEQADRR